MLTKINDDCYIDLDEIVTIDRYGMYLRGHERMIDLSPKLFNLIAEKIEAERLRVAGLFKCR